MSKTITLTLSAPVYRALLARASRRNRTIADEMLAILNQELPPVGQLPEDQEPPVEGQGGEASSAQVFAKMQAEGLIVIPEDVPAELTPLSPKEREDLAGRIPPGTPLSQILDEQRDE